MDINDSSDEETRRFNALKCSRLYVDLGIGLEKAINLIIGDYNDVLTDSYNNNVFNQLINDSLNYRFEDFDIATGPSYNFYLIGLLSLILISIKYLMIQCFNNSC